MKGPVKILLEERTAWSSAAELEELLPLAAHLFETDVLGNIPIGELERSMKDPEDPEKPGYVWKDWFSQEPDGGIILKHPKNEDPSTAIHGQRPDDKIFMQFRINTRHELIKRGCYQPIFDRFFQVMDQIWALEFARATALCQALKLARPDLGLVAPDPVRCTIRVMVYRGARPGDSDLGGKFHTDKNDVTEHLWNSEDALLCKTAAGLTRVPTRRGRGFLFVSDRLARRLGIEAVDHGAGYRQRRKVVVAFIYFKYTDGL